jgi:hypothetical protein
LGVLWFWLHQTLGLQCRKEGSLMVFSSNNGFTK